MNLRAFSRNYTSAKAFFRNPLDRIKYLYWLYSRPLSLGPNRLSFRIRLEPPLRDVSLTVRCNGGSDAFIFSEVFEHRYYDFELPSLPDTVLDLGANIGMTALFFARKYPDARIVCVEPMPVNVDLLRTNLERNSLAVKVFARAVSVEDQTIVMQVAANDYGHKVSNIEYGRTMDGTTLRIEGVSVPTLMKELGWSRISLLKMDIEGYEGVLLREPCEWLERVDALCIECHEGFSQDDLRAVTQRYGFAPPQILAGTTLVIRPRKKISPA